MTSRAAAGFVGGFANSFDPAAIVVEGHRRRREAAIDERDQARETREQTRFATEEQQRASEMAVSDIDANPALVVEAFNTAASASGAAVPATEARIDDATKDFIVTLKDGTTKTLAYEDAAGMVARMKGGTYTRPYRSRKDRAIDESTAAAEAQREADSSRASQLLGFLQTGDFEPVLQALSERQEQAKIPEDKRFVNMKPVEGGMIDVVRKNGQTLRLTVDQVGASIGKLYGGKMGGSQPQPGGTVDSGVVPEQIVRSPVDEKMMRRDLEKNLSKWFPNDADAVKDIIDLHIRYGYDIPELADKFGLKFTPLSGSALEDAKAELEAVRKRAVAKTWFGRRGGTAITPDEQSEIDAAEKTVSDIETNIEAERKRFETKYSGRRTAIPTDSQKLTPDPNQSTDPTEQGTRMGRPSWMADKSRADVEAVLREKFPEAADAEIEEALAEYGY